jgi:hypothetical protein
MSAPPVHQAGAILHEAAQLDRAPVRVVPCVPLPLDVDPARRLLLVLGILLFPPPALALELEFVDVGDPGNPLDDTDSGAVAYLGAISKYEITNAEYLEFQNPVANEAQNRGRKEHARHPDRHESKRSGSVQEDPIGEDR